MSAEQKQPAPPPRRPTTVLHVFGIAPGGGSAATALRQMCGMAARGHRVILATAPSLGWADKVAGTGVELRETLSLNRGFRPISFMRDAGVLKRLIRDEAVDIVHLHKAVGYIVGAYAAWRARRQGRPKVVRSRGVVFPIRSHVFNRWLHNSLTDRVIVTAETIKDMYAGLAGFDASKVVLIHDGLDVSAFDRTPERAAARSRFGLPERATVIGCVARAAEVKGHRCLLEAFAGVREAVPDARLFLVTYAYRPSDIDRLRRWVAESPAADGVTVHDGYMEDPRAAYAAMDIYVLSSTGSEGSSRATLEAMAASLPVVATRVGVLPDIVADRETGVLVAPGDAGALADAITDLVKSDEKARAMGAAGRARARELFTEEMSLDRIEELYLELTTGHTVPEAG